MSYKSKVTSSSDNSRSRRFVENFSRIFGDLLTVHNSMPSALLQFNETYDKTALVIRHR